MHTTETLFRPVPQAHRHRPVGLLLAAGLVVVALAALPLSAASAASTSTSKPKSAAGAHPGAKLPASAQKAFASFQKCLSSHGVKLPSFGSHGGGSFGRSATGAPPSGGFSHPSTGGGSATGGGAGTPPPAGRAFGGGTSKYAKAFAACRKDAPKGFGGGHFGGPGAGKTFKPSAAQQAALSKYVACMTSHGVKMAANATFATIRQLIAADPAAATANKTCQSDLQGAFGPPATQKS